MYNYITQSNDGEGIGRKKRGMSVQNLAVITADLLTKKTSWLAILCRKHGIRPDYSQVKAWTNEWVEQGTGNQCQFRSFIEAKILELKESRPILYGARPKPTRTSTCVNGKVSPKRPME